MKTNSAVRKALGKLPKTLEESYDVIYSQMLNTDPETLRKAEKVILWLLCAERQLSTPEVIGAVHASSYSPEDASPVTDDDLSPVGVEDEPLSIEEILDICCNLVVWDQSLDTFRVAHLSVREYFEKKPQFGKHEIHARALEACIDTVIGRASQQHTASFKLYATTYWPNHCFYVGLEGPTGPLRDKVMTFFFDGYGASEHYLSWAHSLDAAIPLEQGSNMRVGREQSFRLYEATKPLALDADVPSGLSSIVFLASAFNLAWILVPWIQTEIPSNVPLDRHPLFYRKQDRDCPIHVAAICGNVEVARKLLDCGVDVDTRGFKSWTPLHKAAQNGRHLLAKALINRGANVNALSSDGRQFRPIHEAIWNGHPAMVDLLLKHGADIEARDNDGLTPLLLAVKEGKEEQIPILLNWNADVSATDKNGDTAFFLAAERHEPIFILFIQSGKIPESLFGGSVLCSAVRSCSRKSVQTLVEKGIDVNAPDRLGIRPLDYALEQGSSQVISFLIIYGARTALSWNLSSYSVEQWKSETWFSNLIESLVFANSANPAPYIRSILPTHVCREELITISEDSHRVPYLWIRIPDGFNFVSRIVFTTESHDQG
jgi:ankyrin repeat protein